MVAPSASKTIHMLFGQILKKSLQQTSKQKNDLSGLITLVQINMTSFICVGASVSIESLSCNNEPHERKAPKHPQKPDSTLF